MTPHPNKMSKILCSIVEQHPKTRMTTSQFFISWHGVPTLAYTGFSPVLLTVKKEISAAFPSLQKENSGSLWPKTTLGALNDSKNLSLHDLEVLRSICEETQPLIQNNIIDIDALSLVSFKCRSLELKTSTETFPLKDPRDINPPPPEHIQQVTHIMNQFFGPHLDTYLDYVRKPGHRYSYYTQNHSEYTLIFNLNSPSLFSAIEDFRTKVNAALPHVYSWFNRESLHITIRALVLKY